MTTIGPYIIMRKERLPFLEKAHKLARALSEDALDDILAGRKHLGYNPGKKPRKPVAEQEEGV